MDDLDDPDDLEKAFLDAGRALLAASPYAAYCAQLGNGRWIAVGDLHVIRRLLPDEAANDEVVPPAGN